MAATTRLAQLGSLHIFQNVQIALSMLSEAIVGDNNKVRKLTVTVVSFREALKRVLLWLFKLGNVLCVLNF